MADNEGVRSTEVDVIARIKQLAAKWRPVSAVVATLVLAASLAGVVPTTGAAASTGNVTVVAAAQRQPASTATITTTTTAQVSGVKPTVAHEKHLIYKRWGMEHCLVGAYGKPGGRSLVVVIVENPCGVEVQSYALCHVYLRFGGPWVPRWGTINPKEVKGLPFRESGVHCPFGTETPGIWDYGFRINAPVRVDGHRPKPEWSPVYYFRRNAPVHPGG